MFTSVIALHMYNENDNVDVFMYIVKISKTETITFNHTHLCCVIGCNIIEMLGSVESMYI